MSENEQALGLKTVRDTHSPHALLTGDLAHFIGHEKFEITVLIRQIGSMREEVTGEPRQLQNV